MKTLEEERKEEKKQKDLLRLWDSGIPQTAINPENPGCMAARYICAEFGFDLSKLIPKEEGKEEKE